MFKGLGNIGNIASIMGAMQSLPDKMKELNARMQEETVEAASPCGGVQVVMTCVGKLQTVSIVNDELAGEVLELAILEACNTAGSLAKQRYADAIHQMAGDMDLNLPGMDGLLSSLSGNG
ncbi:MAG: YbaB/EbfC family nucleoid-associated protein [Pirellulaceae bacterium]|nr:YbaB/EbfC family nucleoid-associated protein [Pirellulaceae bacterium]